MKEKCKMEIHKDKVEIKSPFTPGPWTVDKLDDYGTYRINEAVIEKDYWTKEGYGEMETDEEGVEGNRRQAIAEAHNEGNRRLIQEALPMLSSLEELANALDDALITHIFEDEKEAAESGYAATIETARAIIAKAKGQQ